MNFTKVSESQYVMMNKDLADKILSACSGKFRGPDVLFGVYSNESGTYVNWHHTHKPALEEMEEEIGPAKFLLDWSKSILEGNVQDDPDGKIVESYWRRATYLYRCDNLFRNASISKQHYATTTGPVGILFNLWRTFKAGYVSEMAQNGKWPQNDPEYDLPYMEWAEIFESNLGDKLKAEIESWD